MELFIVYILILCSLVGAAKAPPVASCIVQTDRYQKAAIATIKSPCGGTMHNFSDLVNERLHVDNAFGSENLADLILSRGGIFDYEQLDLDNLHVCALHHHELGQRWAENRHNRPEKVHHGKRGDKCNMPTDLIGVISHQSSAFAKARAFITKDEAKAIWNQQQKLVHLGTVVTSISAACKAHKEFAQRMVIQDTGACAAACGGNQAAAAGSSGRAIATINQTVEATSNQGHGSHYDLRRQQPAGSYAESPFRHGPWRGAAKEVCPITPGGSQQTPTSHRSSQGDASFEPSPGGGSEEVIANFSQRFQKCHEVEAGIRMIATAIGIPENRVQFPRKEFSNLTQAKKAQKANVALKIINSMMSAFAPDAPSELFAMVAQRASGSTYQRNLPENFVALIEDIRDIYSEVESRDGRLLILGVLSSQLSFEEMQNYFPGLTMYAFKQSRHYIKMIKGGYTIPRATTTRERYDKKKVQSFISFITSPLVVTELPFGYVTVRTTTGVRQELPNLLRNCHQYRIIKQYLAYIKDINQEHLALSEWSLYRLLDACKATTRKSMKGLDYFTYEAAESFDHLLKLVEHLKNMHGDVDWARETSHTLKEMKVFFKTDYKVHISQQSPIQDYSIAYALSDSSNVKFRRPANPVPKHRCAHCLALTDAYKSIAEKIASIQWPVGTASSEFTKAEAEYTLEQAQIAIFEWQKHIIRTINQQKAKDDIMKDLGPYEVLIHCDWAMKFIPEKGRESQTEWYAKRGIPWHVSVAFMRSASTQKWYQRVFVHVFDQLPQNSDAVIAILVDTLQRIKSEVPPVESVYIRSDNAGCYHGAQTLTAVQHISTASGVAIKRWDFSDPQAGKGPCDRSASVIKRHVRAFVAEQNKCTTATEFVKCAASHNGVKSATFVHASLNLPADHGRSKGSIPQISSYHNFEFTGENIRAWYAYDIGVGNNISYTPRRSTAIPKLEPLHLVYTENNNHQHLLRQGAARRFWALLGSRRLPDSERQLDDPMDTWADESTLDEPHQTLMVSTTTCTATAQSVQDTEAEDDPEKLEGHDRQLLFPCNEEGCTKVFQYYHNFVKHVTMGKHTKTVERQSLRDYGVSEYARQVLSSDFLSSYPTIKDALVAPLDADMSVNDPNNLREGWALKTTRKTQRFTAEQRRYLVEKFDEGLHDSRKWTPQQVAKEMKRDARFPDKSSWLTWNQIASFWSRLASKRENSGVGHGTDPIGDEELELEDIGDDPNINDMDSNILETIEAVLAQVFEGSP